MEERRKIQFNKDQELYELGQTDNMISKPIRGDNQKYESEQIQQTIEDNVE